MTRGCLLFVIFVLLCGLHLILTSEISCEAHEEGEVFPYDTSLLWGEVEGLLRREESLSPDDEEAQIFKIRTEDEKITVEWIQKHLIPFLNSSASIPAILVKKITSSAKDAFMAFPYLVSKIRFQTGNERAVIVGDIHGQLWSTLQIFKNYGWPGEDNIYLFNGDLVDRGNESVECLLLLLAFKAALPDKFFINRGNHETESVPKRKFHRHCQSRIKDYPEAFSDFHGLFEYMPYGHLVRDDIFVAHGGLIPDIDLNLMRRTLLSQYSWRNCADLFAFLWNDPCPDEKDVTDANLTKSKRGSSCHEFSHRVTIDFLKRHNLKLFVRSHSFVKNGVLTCHKGACMTIFSAPNYCGGTNAGAVMVVTKTNVSVHPFVL